MQDSFKKIRNGRFVKTLTDLIGHLRRQYKFISKIKSTCPALSATRWLSMGNVTGWLEAHNEDVQTYLDENPASEAYAPDKYWWLLCIIVKRITEKVDITSKSLQGKLGLILVQKEIIQNLHTNLKGKLLNVISLILY